MSGDFRKYEIYCMAVLFIAAIVGLVLAGDPGPAVTVAQGPIAAPEFPSPLIPALVIVSMVASVLAIRKMGEP